MTVAPCVTWETLHPFPPLSVLQATQACGGGLGTRLWYMCVCVWKVFSFFFFFWFASYLFALLILIMFISYPTVFLTCIAGQFASAATRVHVSHHNYFSMQGSRKHATRVHVSPSRTIFSYMCYNTNFFVGPGVHAHTSVITHLPSANLHASHYRYTADLLRLEADSSRSPAICWPSYQTPINTGAMLPYLKAFPNRDFACYIRTGLTNGFHVGFTRRRDLLRSHCHNHPSLRANPAVVDEQIASGLVAGRLLGPISQDRFPFVHTSPLGLVPKSHQTNQWRLIHDLSSPKDYSVTELCSLRYASVDQAVSIIQKLGRDTQLIKLDIKDAYRIVPVHPSDYHLLGIEWKGNTYLDRALPFGLRSAPKIFNALADFVTWILASSGIQYQLHYLDDFLFYSSLLPRGGNRFFQWCWRFSNGLVSRWH